ncbi:amino acid ABC transporter substrate-binding protein [Paucibacter sp. B2R-40]|uniref:amino acid ABC transporter substrate-binding protein n=1 Tax=Paucibacter sp. B2R-40 TaxID=2893554 RepID=UPI0021E4A5F0|nr:amino acid ABC transporter substrate-binding protein [Paucibacter sp. B2R-40]MCV2353828.1 amino acid ABC transporter substrate-binding protein [Paucibacter sp. B2R-40]
MLCLLVGLLTRPVQGETLDSSTLRKIRDTGVIVLGYRVDSAPFSYLDEKLRPIGYSLDICGHIIRAIKTRLENPDLELKLVAVSSATRMPLVANGSVDLECGVTTHTVERQKTQAFSLTTFVAETRLLSKRSAGVRVLADLRGKPVASTIATTSIQLLHQANLNQQLGLKILVGQDDRDAFRLLQSGRAAAYAMDDVLLRMLLLSVANPGDYEISVEAFSLEPYAIGLPRGDAGFKALVDASIAGLYQRGEIQAIYRKWFESPIASRGLNLQMPMSEAFKRVIDKPTDAVDPQHYR